MRIVQPARGGRAHRNACHAAETAKYAATRAERARAKKASLFQT